ERRGCRRGFRNSFPASSAGWASAIGRVSYSLYLWQQIFVDRSSRAWWTSFPRNALLAGLVAFASYWLIEQPSMSVRRTLQDWFARTFSAAGEDRRSRPPVTQTARCLTQPGSTRPACWLGYCV